MYKLATAVLFCSSSFLGCVNTMTQAELLESYQLDCQNFKGLENNTSEMAKCIQNMEELALKLRRARLEALSEMSNSSNDDSSTSNPQSSNTSAKNDLFLLSILICVNVDIYNKTSQSERRLALTL